jgi:hypothetical protein
VAVPVDKSTWRPVYSKAIAIEVESCNEVETHPEQVAHNWVKESVRDFAEVHTWTWDTCFEKLKLVYGKVGVDGAKVKIFSAKQGRQTPRVSTGGALVEQPPVRQGRSVELGIVEAPEEDAGEEGGPIVEPAGGAVAGGQPSEPGRQAQQEQTTMPQIPVAEPVEKGGTYCASGRVEFKLSDGRVVCVQGDLAGVLRVFAERGYRVEASKSRIVVYDERGREVFSSSF